MHKIFPMCLCLSMAVIAQGTAHAQDYVYATGNQALSTQIPIENGFINVNLRVEWLRHHRSPTISAPDYSLR